VAGTGRHRGGNSQAGARPSARDRDPVLGSGTGQILTAAADGNWTVVDMATDWSTVHSPNPA
jgi:hypothetical protein